MHSPRRTSAAARQEVWRWREQGFTYAEISERTGLSEATLSRILRGHCPAPPPAPVVRYERAHPGELLHLDIKKLGRIARPSHRVTGDRRDQARGIGWECLHVCIDDHSRFSHAAMRADERKDTAVAFLEQVVAHYRALGITVQRVMTDNGPCYKSAAFRKACARLAIKHLFQALHPEDQRQSGTLHPVCSTRVGLRLHLPTLYRSHRRPSPSGFSDTTGVGLTVPYNATHPSPGSDWRTTS